MDAHAVLVADHRDGRLTLPVLRSDPPILLRPTGDTVHLVGGSAGPLGGDRLRLDLTVRRGSTLRLRSAAASVVLPGPVASSLHLHVVVEPGAHLEWRPEPAVSVAGGAHRQVVIIELVGDATLDWTEAVVLGRTDEASGDWDATMRVERDGAAMTHQQIQLGPSHHGSQGPASMDRRRVLASRLRVGPPPHPTEAGMTDSVRWGRFVLAHDAGQTQAIGGSVTDVMAFVDGPDES